jgi:hypothetical protein
MLVCPEARRLAPCCGIGDQSSGEQALEAKRVKTVRTGHIVWEAVTGRVGEVVKPRTGENVGESSFAVRWNDDGSTEVLDRTCFYGSNKVDWIISREPGLFQGGVAEETVDRPTPW